MKGRRKINNSNDEKINREKINFNKRTHGSLIAEAIAGQRELAQVAPRSRVAIGYACHNSQVSDTG